MNQIINGDCLEVMKDIPDKSIDMVLCDLPYGNKTHLRWDVIIPFEALWVQYKRVIKDNGAIVLFGSQPFTSRLIMSNIDMFKYEWIYEKNNSCGFLFAKLKPMSTHENVLVFSKANTSPGNKNNMLYFPQGLKVVNKKMRQRKDSTNGLKINRFKLKEFYFQELGNYPKSVLSFNSPLKSNRGLHPTQKPVALCEYLIKTYTSEGETVLDNCCGSGTTAIACLNTNRKYICIEKDTSYFEIAKKRIEAHVIK